jgi:hypothetical protein
MSQFFSSLFEHLFGAKSTCTWVEFCVEGGGGILRGLAGERLFVMRGWCGVWSGVVLLICDWTGGRHSSENGCCCLLLVMMMVMGAGFKQPTLFSFVHLVWCSGVKLKEHSQGAHHVHTYPFPA